MFSLILYYAVFELNRDYLALAEVCGLLCVILVLYIFLTLDEG